MNIKGVVGSVGKYAIIFELDNGIFAVVDPKEKWATYSWDWLYIARWDKVYSRDQIDSQLIMDARNYAKDIDETELREYKKAVKQMETLKKEDPSYYDKVMEEQKKFLAESKKRGDGLYL